MSYIISIYWCNILKKQCLYGGIELNPMKKATIHK